MDLRRDETVQGERSDSRIGINHEHVLVECRIDTNDVLDLVVDLQLQRIHRRIEVNLEKEKEETQKDRHENPDEPIRHRLKNE